METSIPIAPRIEGQGYLPPRPAVAAAASVKAAETTSNSILDFLSEYKIYIAIGILLIIVLVIVLYKLGKFDEWFPPLVAKETVLTEPKQEVKQVVQETKPTAPEVKQVVQEAPQEKPAPPVQTEQEVIKRKVEEIPEEAATEENNAQESTATSLDNAINESKFCEVIVTPARGRTPAKKCYTKLVDGKCPNHADG